MNLMRHGKCGPLGPSTVSWCTAMRRFEWKQGIWGRLMRNDWRKAAVEGNLAVIDSLLREGIDIDSTDKYGQTALMLAVVNHQADIAKILVAAGADTAMRGSGAPGFSGKTAADLAEDAGLEDLASYLATFDRPE